MNHRRSILPLLVIAVLTLVALVLWASAGRWAVGRAEAIANTAADRAARSHAELLSSELQKFRLLPLVLVEYPDVSDLLAGDVAVTPRLDRTLALLAARTDAAAIYVIDRRGNTLAASNWRLPTSFVGQNYGFRPYFRGALRRGSSELFALGTISGRPGMFLARRVERAGKSLGVVVVKVEFDRIEANWAHTAGPTMVVDPNGVILVTSRPAWRFHTTHPRDVTTIAQARRSLQFGTAPLQPAPITTAGAASTIGDERYRRALQPVSIAGANLVYFEPLAPALAAATANVRFWSLVILCIIALAGAIVLRGRERQLLQRRAQAALESEVESRTLDLRETNMQLQAASRERIAADSRYRKAREDLAQANRLGSLGQITAGVAHEINQPVAAIRLHAENAGLFFDRDRPERVRDSLTTIISLTDRIGSITGELRGFARKRTPEAGPIPLDLVIEGTLLLAGDRVRDLTQVVMPDPVPTVFGDRVRLEQILVNLLQNAADALQRCSDPRIDVVVIAGDPVTVRISDNGAGIDAALVDDVFTPFVTGKAAGLGLGLGIARDIAREFGGEIELVSSDRGATFNVRLRPA